MTGGECCLSAGGSSLQDAHPAFVPFTAFIISIIISFSCFVKSHAASSDTFICKLKSPPRSGEEMDEKGLSLTGACGRNPQPEAYIAAAVQASIRNSSRTSPFSGSVI